ncbi:MAG: AAA family ATPase, partial [Flavobacteriaceae bacterium]
MKLISLSLTNYKNIEATRYTLDDRINCFIGNNGVGKSSILDAIYHLCFGKSYFNPSAVQNIQFGKDFFLLEGHFSVKNREEKIICSLKKG